ncbi:ATP-binding protein [Glutamicibacter protophormiae]|uniref:ATPase with chaperone activity n=1 Tax=Glutamicibacter protophormiae TaxID=37930 RepID=A0ABS4XQA1_GLUPR|nr:ATP-binding protein [Glutamicibacter protophormiae]MBP2398525.1 putative ATPase with chaperone activity [Glutamicibacter protophormiae]WPR65390.1 ATP-binding protein [Glutamicibacter protophormiae]WPR68888.1 ATP-binding protein [Glutamicibacter protophormiae]GGL94678.1 hypothetical protein GCM10010038_26060 [Glutamicibacter protophormiae]
MHSITYGAQEPITALRREPEFIAPHHTASLTVLIGSGTRKMLPGAITRAHHGVLFLEGLRTFALVMPGPGTRQAYRSVKRRVRTSKAPSLS